MDDNQPPETYNKNKIPYFKPNILLVGSLKNIIKGASGSGLDGGFASNTDLPPNPLSSLPD